MRRALLVVVLTLAILAGLVLWRADELGVSELVDDLTGQQDPPAPEGPAAVPPPPGLDLPALPRARAVLPGLGDRPVDPRAVRRALARLPDARRLGPRVAVAVAGVDGRPVVQTGPDVIIPASTLKLVTSITALEVLGPETRFTTSVVRRGGELFLVGGGDPLLAARPDPDAVPARADLTTLARATAAEVGRGTRVSLRYDDSWFAGPAVSPDWKPDYISDSEVAPITALWVDEGRDPSGSGARVADPSRTAAARFAEALRAAGVRVTGAPRPGTAPDREPVAEVRGAELVEIVQHVLEVSDNEGAEVLLRQAAIGAGRPGSFAAGARTVTETLADLDVAAPGARVLDGSGLARGNRFPVRGLLDVLATAMDPDHPLLDGVATGLPVAGFSGSLVGRFLVGADAGLGYVRAKTGTLSGVHGLAGIVTGRDGTPMLFVAAVDRAADRNALFARARLDQISAALAACACGR